MAGYGQHSRGIETIEEVPGTAGSQPGLRMDAGVRVENLYRCSINIGQTIVLATGEGSAIGPDLDASIGVLNHVHWA